MYRRFFVTVLAVTILHVFVTDLSGQNLITNPGFETGDNTGWTVNGFRTGADNLDPHTGLWECAFGQYNGDLESISQTISTTAGATYGLDFWLADDEFSDGPTQIFRVYWDGHLIYDRSSDNSSFSYLHVDQTSGGWSDLVASGSSATLMFVGRNDPSSYYLDDISLTYLSGPTVVPEPSTYAAAVAAVACLAAGHLRRRRLLTRARA